MDDPLRVLFIEDSEDDARLLLREIGRGGYRVESERVETPAAMRKALEDRAWDLIICDYSLPNFNAPQALELLQSAGIDLPFIILSGSVGEETAIAALKAGAHDFLIKSSLARLVPAIQRELREAGTRRERRHAEQALREAETRYRTLVEQIPAITYMTALDEENRLLYISPQIQRLGYTSEEWLADPQSWLKRLHPEDRERVLAELARCLQSGELLRYEYRLLDREGHILWLRDEASIVRDESGRPLYLQGILLDVGDRRQRERELEAIVSVSTALRSASTLDEILHSLLDQMLALVGTEAGSIWLYDLGRDEIRLEVQRGWEGPLPGPLKRGEDIPGLVFESGEPVVAREFRADRRVAEQNHTIVPAGVGGACLPLRSAESVVGIVFINTYLPRELNPGELQMLNALTEIGGSAIHRMRLFEQTLRQIERLSALQMIDRVIKGSFDLRVTLELVLEQINEQLEVDASDVLLLRAGSATLEFAAGKGFHTGKVERTMLHAGDGYAGRAVLERRLIRVEDLSKAERTFARAELFAEEHFASYFAIPLIARGKVEGVLEIFHRSPLRPDPDWLAFLETLGGQTAIAVDSARLFQDLQQSNLDLILAYDTTIEGWSRALDLRDKETEGHTLRVTEMTVKLARKWGMTDEQILHVRRGALLHDIGKMGIPDNILLKPGELTEDEWAIMRQHPRFAFDLLVPILYLKPALDIPYCHHEKWDGTGYPRGLKGEQIPLAARLFAVADVWDALTSDRPYRPAWTTRKALAYLRRQAGKHFDPQTVELFIQVILSKIQGPKRASAR